MNHGRTIAVLFAVAAGVLFQQQNNLFAADNGDVGKIVEPELAQELQVRVNSDQAARMAWIEFMVKHDISGKDRSSLDPQIVKKCDALTNKMEDEDRQNTIWLKNIVQKHGWPGKSLVGTKGASNAWLLVQHADKDRDFQQMCLKKMEALPKGEVSARDIALLTDRILSGTGKKQKYGTQALVQDGRVVAYPIEDEEHVDERRRAIGMEPLAEYLSFMEKSYGLSKAPDSAKDDKKQK